MSNHINIVDSDQLVIRYGYIKIKTVYYKRYLFILSLFLFIILEISQLVKFSIIISVIYLIGTDESFIV